MKKITEQDLLEYVSEVGEFDKEHRKYSSFYCTVTHRFTQEYQELVPEVVIPEHYVTKYKTSAFKPVFE